MMKTKKIKKTTSQYDSYPQESYVFHHFQCW